MDKEVIKYRKLLRLRVVSTLKEALALPSGSPVYVSFGEYPEPYQLGNYTPDILAELNPSMYTLYTDAVPLIVRKISVEDWGMEILLEDQSSCQVYPPGSYRFYWDTDIRPDSSDYFMQEFKYYERTSKKEKGK